MSKILAAFLASALFMISAASTYIYLVTTNTQDIQDSEPLTEVYVSPETKEKPEINGAALDHFYEIAIGSEFGEHVSFVQKWTQPTIGISTTGPLNQNDTSCLNQTIDDFNALSASTKMRLVDTSPDITIHFAPEPSFSGILSYYVPRNMGFFSTNRTSQGILLESTILIDTATVNDTERCHLIREELTQSTGLMNDSPKFADSIFYTEWSYTTSYSDMDKELIKILYGDYGVHPGMNISQVEDLFVRK